MDLSTIVEKAQGLSDIELAMLLCFMASQHCLIHTDSASMKPLRGEVQLVTSSVFGLSHSVIRCSNSTTLDEFRDGLLIEVKPEEKDHSSWENGVGFNSGKRSRLDRSPTLPSFESARRGGPSEQRHNTRGIANVLIVEGLSLASEDVQIQALELLRTRRLFTHTAVHTAPTMFLMIILTADTDPRLVNHLNDHVFISHHHDPEDGFPNLEEASDWIEDDRASLSSVVHRSGTQKMKFCGPALLSKDEVRELANASNNTTMTAEITAYVHNIITFLRLHRAVAGGISPKATRMLKILINCLAPLHGLKFATPALVLLAISKIYSHRIVLATPVSDRSLQYGSDIRAVQGLLEGLKAEDVIEEVLEEVEIPV